MLQGLATLTTNPVLTDVLGGLAASATAFAAVERMLLWNMRNMTVEPFGETVQQVFARISALRDSLDGPQVSKHLCCFVINTMLCCAVIRLNSAVLCRAVLCCPVCTGTMCILAVLTHYVHCAV